MATTNSSYLTFKSSYSLLARQKPEVKVEYYTENFQQQYPTTITDEELKGAFRNANGLSEMTARILQAPILVQSSTSF